MINPFAYFKPKTLGEATEALSSDGALSLAGGTDLLVDLRNGIRQADLVVDIKGLEGANDLFIDRDRGISISLAVPLNVLVDDAKLREICPVLGEAALTIATYQLRNRATLVGNICNASPAADMAPPLYVLDAKVVIAGPDGERKLPIQEFITGVKKTALKRGELVLRVEIPAGFKGGMAFLKKQRVKGHDLASINVAGLADPERGALRICIGAGAATPLLLEGTDGLYGKTKDPGVLADQVAELAAGTIRPISDVRASEEYRRDMVAVFVKRLVKIICA